MTGMKNISVTKLLVDNEDNTITFSALINADPQQPSLAYYSLEDTLISSQGISGMQIQSSSLGARGVVISAWESLLASPFSFALLRNSYFILVIAFFICMESQ